MSKQLDRWMGKFGDDYTERNILPNLADRVRFWGEVMYGINAARILEVGCGDGKNLDAISRMCSAHQYHPSLYGVEPNREAIKKARRVADVREGVAQQLPFSDGRMDTLITCGVLIHIHPDDLQKAMEEIYRVAYTYIVCAEYFSDQPETKEYRGEADLLFTRDFGKAWLDLYPDLRVVNYGFAWKPVTRMDNLTWFVFQKRLA